MTKKANAQPKRRKAARYRAKLKSRVRRKKKLSPHGKKSRPLRK